jgi:hypothetical protein
LYPLVRLGPDDRQTDQGVPGVVGRGIDRPDRDIVARPPPHCKKKGRGGVDTHARSLPWAVGAPAAPPPPRLLAKSILGVSIWVRVLLDKFLFYRPTYRLLADLRQHGLDLSLGTLTDGLQRLLPLFAPLYEKFVDRQRHQHH